MSFVVKQVVPETVKWLSETNTGWWVFTEDITQRCEFSTVKEAQTHIRGSSGSAYVVVVDSAEDKTPLQQAKFYRLSQGEYNSYGTYDSCIVVAHSEEEARLIHPKSSFLGDDWWFSSSWCSKDQTHLLKVEELGIAYDHLQPGTVVMSSFNAG